MFETIFENDDLIAVDKPAGWLTVPSRFEKEDGRIVLGREIEKKLAMQIFPVHRLDLEVGGLVMFAKNARAQKNLNRLFELRHVVKTYHAESGPRNFGHWPPDLKASKEDVIPGERTLWQSRILRGKRRSYESPHGDEARTEAKLLAQTNSVFKWELRPLTGRAHQLRFEMSRHGFPVLGDKLYGGKPVTGEGIALRAVALDFSKVPEGERGPLPASLVAKGLF